MPTIFTKIINGEIPSHKVAETDQFLAFLDINPNAKGHTLCIPKKEVDKLFDLDDGTYSDLMLFSKRVATAIEKSMDCKRVAMSVIGIEVPHAHVHLIPINNMDDIRFVKKERLNETDFKTIATLIRSNFQE